MRPDSSSELSLLRTYLRDGFSNFRELWSRHPRWRSSPLRSGGGGRHGSVRLSSQRCSRARATLVVKVLEEATKEGIIGSVFERKLSAVVHVGGHLFGVSLTQELYRGVNFALFDFLILLVLVFGTLESLPRQLTFKHVE